MANNDPFSAHYAPEPKVFSTTNVKADTPAKPHKPSSCDFGWCFIGAGGWMFPETHVRLDPQACQESAEQQEHIVTEGGRVARVKLVERT